MRVSGDRLNRRWWGVGALGAVAVAATILSGGVGASVPPPAAPSTGGSHGITFDHATIVDPFHLVGEPDITIDHAGGIYTSGPFGTSTQASYFWKSSDGGVQWHPVGVLPAEKQNSPAGGGGDTEMTTDVHNNVYASDLQSLVCNATFRSTDQGATFTPSEGCSPSTDRQWMDTYTDAAGKTRIYLAANGDLAGCYMLVSTDGGLTYPPANIANKGSISGSRCEGKFVVDQTDGALYAPISGGQIWRSGDGGSTWTHVGDSGASANLFASLSVDRRGHLYQAWADNDGHHSYLSVSTDHGANWRQFTIDTPGIHNYLMPWSVAGDDGRVAAVYYGTSDGGHDAAGDPGTAAALWHVYAVFSTDATSAHPHFSPVQVDEHPMHRGPICNNGLNCELQVPAGDRSLADFFQVSIDPDGRVYVVYNDSGDLGQVTGFGKSYVAVARQRTGPSLYARKGVLTPTAWSPVKVTQSHAVKRGLKLSGTHGLPAGNWTSDPAKDAIYPVTPVAGPNIAAMDILSASAGDDGAGNLTFRMTLSDLSPQAIATAAQAAGAPAWVFTWYWDNKHYFVESIAGHGFVYGTVGSIEEPPIGEPKVLTYVPSGQATGSTDGNTISITVPAANVGNPGRNAKLDNVTAFTWAERGPIPAVVDEAKSFSYRVGTPAALQHAADGRVEISIDSAGFSHPVTATITGGAWSADLSGLKPGRHVVYVREILSAALYNPGSWDDVPLGPVVTLTVNVPA